MASFLQVIVPLFLLSSVFASGSLASSKFHILENFGTVPNCQTSDESDFSASSTMKVRHAHGPCSPIGSTVVDMTEFLRQEQERVDNIHKRLSGSVDTSVRRQLATVGVRSGSTVSAGGMFVMTIGLGTPPRSQTVFVETGSNTCWVQCSPCTDFCYIQQEPYFNPTISSTYEHVPCSSPFCPLPDFSRCNSEGLCIYGAFYATGSTSGFLSNDTLTLTADEVLPNFVFGCSENFQGSFGRAAGVFGLGRKPLSVISQAGDRYAGKFSYCLPYAENGTGYVNFGLPTVNNVTFTTPMLTYPNDDTFYGITLLGITVSGQRIPVNETVFSTAGTVLDTGISMTFLPPPAYAPFRDAMRSGMRRLGYGEPMSMGIQLDTCYDVSGRTALPVPTIQMLFAGGLLSLQPGNTVMQFNATVVCLAFAPNEVAADVTIIGGILQKGYEISLDLEQQTIGFHGRVC